MILMQGDCLELMRDIPDGSVDMVLTDPPFGITKNAWDKAIPFEPMWEQYRRICKENAAIVLFSAQLFTSTLIVSNLADFKYTLTWYKHYARNFLNAKKQPLRTTEQIAVFCRKQCTYNPKMRKGEMRNKGSSSKQRGCYGNYKALNVKNDQYYPTDILDFAGVATPDLEHPTQKPVPLLEYLIKTYTNPGETVLDNCMGSGSTGVAAVNTGRDFIGIELDPGYFETACRRIEEAQAQIKVEAVT